MFLDLFWRNVSLKLYTNMDGQARSVFNFLDIQCVVTLYDFPQTSRQWEYPLPNIMMKIVSFPYYTFMEGVSYVSNCLSLPAHFQFLDFSQDTEGRFLCS